MSPLAGWDNFYVVVGSSAGALVGLQFVVITLVTNRPATPGQSQAGEAFATPTIVHFSSVLALSAMMNAPWQGVVRATILVGLLGLCGIGYEILVARRMIVQKAYKPVLEDWLFHFIFPAAAYGTLVGCAIAAHSYLREALFGTATAAMALLFIGIHNAWDAVMYHIYSREPKQAKNES